MRIAIALSLALLLGACSQWFDVRTDHDPEVDFSKFHTFFVPPSDRPDTPDALDNSLVLKRIGKLIVARVEERGLTQAPEAEADLSLRFWLTSKEWTEVTAMPANPFYGPWVGPYPIGWGRWGPMYDDVITRKRTEGTLVLDLLDARSGALVWRAYVVGNVARDRDQSFESLDQAVAKALAKFPPRGARAE